ncbi:MAG: RHS repeat-associated core domain-containing protein [Pirellulaceae bacterium]
MARQPRTRQIPGQNAALWTTRLSSLGWARYYAAHLGRFCSRDPIGYEGGINLLEYVGDSPLMRTDPSGLWGPLYGNYCGPLRNGQDGPPKDALDQACAEHDECLKTWRQFITPCRRRYCDSRLCWDALAALVSGCSSSPTPWSCRHSANTIASIMCSIGTAPLPWPW